MNSYAQLKEYCVAKPYVGRIAIPGSDHNQPQQVHGETQSV
jgi:hypothetical protein